jgi:hypothetical protein
MGGQRREERGGRIEEGGTAKLNFFVDYFLQWSPLLLLD